MNIGQHFAVEVAETAVLEHTRETILLGHTLCDLLEAALINNADA